MITLGRRGDLHARRQATSFLRSRDVVHKLFAEVAPLFKDRPGGYTRIVKLGPRAGDSAEMAYLELVDEEYVAKERDARTPEPVAASEPEADAVSDPGTVSDTTDEAQEDAEEVSDTEVSDTQVAETPPSDADASDSGADESADEGDDGPGGADKSE
jgi:large subunit ribosomal protein L17